MQEIENSTAREGILGEVGGWKENSTGKVVFIPPPPESLCLLVVIDSLLPFHEDH